MGSAVRRPAWRSPFALVTAAALAVAVAVIVLNQKPAPPPTDSLARPPLAYAAELVDGEALGQADAPVVMALYSDFQCPVCGRFIREQLGSLKTEFIDPGILRIEAHDIAFLGAGDPDESLELATGARCAAGQDRYWTFHDYVFWNQQRESRGDYSAEFIRSIAAASGLDLTAWDACVAGGDARDAIRAATRTAMAAGINATPTISLNGGRPVPGLPDAAALAASIRALAAASASPGPSSSPAPSAGPS